MILTEVRWTSLSRRLDYPVCLLISGALSSHRSKCLTYMFQTVRPVPIVHEPKGAVWTPLAEHPVPMPQLIREVALVQVPGMCKLGALP